MLTFFFISNLECNQPTLHCSPCHPHPNLTLIPFLKALIPFLSIMKLFFKESSTVIVPVSTALKLHKLYIVKTTNQCDHTQTEVGPQTGGFVTLPPYQMWIVQCRKCVLLQYIYTLSLGIVCSCLSLSDNVYSSSVDVMIYQLWENNHHPWQRIISTAFL